MGTPRFYWHPVPGGSAEEIDLGEGASDIQELPGAEAVDAYGGDGSPYRHWLGSTQRVRIVLERFGAPGKLALERQFQTLLSHLQRGRKVTFSLDHDKTWCAAATGIPSRGNLIIPVTSNGLAGFSASATLATGDEVVIETPWPDGRREIRATGTISGSIVNLPISGGVVYTYGAVPLVRWRDCYPVAWLPEDQLGKSYITHDHRRNYTLDITLEYSVALSLALFEGEEQALQGQEQGLGAPQLLSTSGQGGATLDELVQRVGEAGYERTPTWRR